MIDVDRINAYYGDSHVLFDVSMQVREREVVALLGRNGAGKSTTLKTLAGVLRPRSGTIHFDGAAIEQLPSYQIAGLGLQLVPEERRIFGALTVAENLDIAALSAREPLPLDEIADQKLDPFPFGRAQAGKRLIEEQHRGPRREG